LLIIAQHETTIMNNQPEENGDIGVLLKNISDGLSVLSLAELNEEIAKIVRKKMQSERLGDLDNLFLVVCSEFSVSKPALYHKYSRSKVYQAKITMYAIMNTTLGMSRRSIAKIFEVFPNSVNVGINYFRDLNPERFPSDKSFLVKYQRCLAKFLEKIKQPV
jgi:hypothetical protein